MYRGMSQSQKVWDLMMHACVKGHCHNYILIKILTIHIGFEEHQSGRFQTFFIVSYGV